MREIIYSNRCFHQSITAKSAGRRANARGDGMRQVLRPGQGGEACTGGGAAVGHVQSRQREADRRKEPSHRLSGQFLPRSQKSLCGHAFMRPAPAVIILHDSFTSLTRCNSILGVKGKMWSVTNSSSIKATFPALSFYDQKTSPNE